MIKVINGLIFENGKVLVVKKKDKYILPKGKLENELYFHCLEREFREELNDTKIDVEKFYKNFSGIIPFSKRAFETDVYFCKLINKLSKPSAEISDRKYVSKKGLKAESFSNVTKEILENLIKEGYLK
jgi:8-oxo-dGTP pyrophosphatase MutT (NUDIX family)